MPKAKQTHLKNQTAFSFHMQNRKWQNVNYRQLPWDVKFFPENSNSSFETLLFSIFNKIASKAEKRLTSCISRGDPSGESPLLSCLCMTGKFSRPQPPPHPRNCRLWLNCTHQENKRQAVITKVNELNSSFCCQKNVIPLDISVDDSVTVQMLKALHGVPPSPNNRKKKGKICSYFKTIKLLLKI